MNDVLKDKTKEMIARKSFGSADWLKVQSQHERFLREIKKLPENEKAQEITNAVKYLMDNKSDYWLETAHLLDILLGYKEKKGLFKLVDPDVKTKKEFCDKHLEISYPYARKLIQIINIKELSEEKLRVLGFSKTRELLSAKQDNDTKVSLSDMEKKDIDEIKELLTKRRKKRERTPFEKLLYVWERSPKKDRDKFLRFLDGERQDTNENKKSH